MAAHAIFLKNPFLWPAFNFSNTFLDLETHPSIPPPAYVFFVFFFYSLLFLPSYTNLFPDNLRTEKCLRGGKKRRHMLCCNFSRNMLPNGQTRRSLVMFSFAHTHFSYFDPAVHSLKAAEPASRSDAVTCSKSAEY